MSDMNNKTKIAEKVIGKAKTGIVTVAQTTARTTFKAGATFFLTLVLGALLGAVISIVAGVFYWGLFADHEMASGVIAVLLKAAMSIIGVLLFGFVALYGALAFYYAWRRAIQKAVEENSLPFSERVSTFLAGRIAAMPRSEDRLSSLRQWLSEGHMAEKLNTFCGDSFWLRQMAKFAARHLPWSEMLADWEQALKSTAASGEANTKPDAVSQSEKASLAAVLSPRIAGALNEAATPSNIPLIAAIAAHLALFGLGVGLM